MSDINYWDFKSFLLYMLVLLFGLLVCKVSSKKRQDGTYSTSLFSLIIAFVPFFLVVILRDINRGNDSYAYFLTFQNLGYDSANEVFSLVSLFSREPLYTLAELFLSKVISGYNDTLQRVLYFSMQTVWWMFFVILALKEECKNNGTVIAFATVFIIFFAQSFNIIRNTIAMGMLLYAFTQLAQGKGKKYLIINALTVGVHYTAIIGFLAYFYIRNYKHDKVIKGLIIFFLFLVIIYLQDFLTLFFAGQESRYEELATGSVAFGIGNIAKRLPLLFVVFIFRRQLIAINNHNKLYIDLLWLDLFVSQLCYVNPMFNRITLYFGMIQIFIFPSLYILLEKKIQKTGASFVAVCFFSFMIYYTFNYYIYTNPYNFMPYYSPFFKL